MHLNAIERQPGVLEEMPMPKDFRLAGWVYMLSNEYMPGIYKIGMTTTSPEVRAKELSSATGVPFPFKIEAAFHCDNPANSERLIHEDLQDVRINDSREFFQDNADDLASLCEQHCEAKVGTPVEYLAMDYDVISFESLTNLSLPELFDDIGISVFGDKLAIAERLIRLGAELVQQKLNSNRMSIVFHDDKAYAVEDAESSWRRKHEKEQEELEASLISAGIYGPQPLSAEDPIPF
jgi:hypothetical protein